MADTISPEDFYSLVLEKDPSQAYQTLDSIPLYSRLPFVSFRNQNGEERYLGQTPLHAAVRAGHVQLAQLLLDSGSDKDARKMDNCTPIFLASFYGHHRVVEILLAAGADKNAPWRDGATPLNVASREGHYQVVELLLAAGVDINAPDNEGCTPICKSAFNGHHRVVELLLAAGADKDASKIDGATPMDVASCYGHYQVVELLLAADDASQASSRLTSLAIAKQNSHSDLVELLSSPLPESTITNFRRRQQLLQAQFAKFLLIGPPPRFNQSLELSSAVSLSHYLQHYLAGDLSKSDFSQLLSSRFDITRPIFIGGDDSPALEGATTTPLDTTHVESADINLVVSQTAPREAAVAALMKHHGNIVDSIMELKKGSIENINISQLRPLYANTILRHLVITKLSIPDALLQQFAHWLSSNPVILTVTLYDSKISSSGGILIGNSLRTNSTLINLNLSHNCIGSEGGIAIGESLRINSTLTELNICHNFIGKEGEVAIAKSLRTNSTLTELNLSQNSIGQEGGIAIGESLLGNSALTQLNLEQNSIGSAAARAIGESLRTNSTLMSLNLRNNSIEKRGGIMIAESLRTNSTLTELNLWNNSIGTEGGIAMGESLLINSTLTELNLGENSIEHLGGTAISEALNFKFSLLSLHMEGNPIPSPLNGKLDSQLGVHRLIRDQFLHFFSDEFPRFDSLSLLSTIEERISLTNLFQAFSREYCQQSFADFTNIQQLNELKKQPNRRSDLIEELDRLDSRSILPRLQELSASVDVLYSSPLAHQLTIPPSPQPSSSSTPTCSSSPSLSSSPISSSPSPFSFDTFNILQTEILGLIQTLHDRYPVLMNELCEQAALVKNALSIKEHAQPVSTAIWPIRNNQVAQNLLTEAKAKMNQSLNVSLNNIQSQIQKAEIESRFLRSLMTAIPQVGPLIRSKITEAQQLRDSIVTENEAEVAQLRNIIGRAVQSLANSYREQIKVYEGRRQSRQAERAESARLGFTDDIAKLDQDIADIEIQLHTPQRLLDEITQLASRFDVDTTPPTMTIEELRHIGTLAHFELDHRHIEVGEIIGVGGMAYVYNGRFFRTPVAIKRLFKNEDFAALQKEVKNWYHFHHPHILAFIGYSPVGPLIVMELMDKSLADILYLKSTILGKPPPLDEPPLPKISFDQRFRMIYCIASGLCYLHSKDMVHRDIKSLNILVRGFSEDSLRFDIKIADFGATRSLATLGRTTVGIKTHRWAAPELYRTGAVTTFKSDMFAYVMVMYEILIQHLPFHHLKTELELVEALGQQERPSFSKKELDYLKNINHDKFNALVDLMTVGWNEDPTIRPSAQMILERLTEIQKIHTIIKRDDLDLWNQDFGNAFPPVFLPSERIHSPDLRESFLASLKCLQNF